MKTIVTSSLAFAAVAMFAAVGFADPRDAGSKARGEAYEGTSEAIRSPVRYYYRQVPVAQAPVVAAQPQAVAPSAAPVQPPANATAAVDNTRSGTRTFSVEPQTTAPTMTYRAYAPRRNFMGYNDYRADRKVLGHYGY